jgi:hypothetical protein
MLLDVAELIAACPRCAPPRVALNLCALLMALAPMAVCSAGGASDPASPRLRDRSAPDGQDYSYYYVPRLSDLNHFIGTLFRSGHVRLDAPAPTFTITRYAAYSCEGTLFIGGDADRGASENIDWSTVTELRSGQAAGSPSLVIDREPQARSTTKPLVLYFSDAATGYYLHQALAVLVTECRPKQARDPGAQNARPTS